MSVNLDITNNLNTVAMEGSKTNVTILDRLDFDENVIIYKNLDRQDNLFVSAVTGYELFKNLPYSTEKTIDELSLEDFSDSYVTLAQEGTILRVFNTNGTWYCATNNRLQAYKSNWADKKHTFGNSFANAVANTTGSWVEMDSSVHTEDDENISTRQREIKEAAASEAQLNDFFNKNLNKDCVYFFLLRCIPGERIVCDAPDTETAFHLGTIDENGEWSHEAKIYIDNCGPFRKPTRIFPKNKEDLRQMLRDVDVKHHQGIIIITGNIHHKLMSDEYTRLASIRGTVSSLRLCYLKYRDPKLCETKAEFLKLYPEFESKVKPLERHISVICRKIHEMYVIRYRMHNNTILSKQIHIVLCELHAQFNVSRKPTTLAVVYTFLAENYTRLNQLINTDFFQ